MLLIRIGDEEWTLGERLPGGEGGHGVVYECHSRAGQTAAVKLVEKVTGADRELLIAEGVKSLHGVIPVWGTGETDSHFALLMPLAGPPLDVYLDMLEPLPYDEAYPILIEIATDLVEIHERGVVHQDLKPGNVLWWDGAWRLSDFGISRYADATPTLQSRNRRTTSAYAAPEQWRGERVSPAADIYAFGVICHEALTRTHPFRGPEVEEYRNQQLHHVPPDLRGAPPHVAVLVMECLAKAPEARPSADELVRRLKFRPSERSASEGIRMLQDAKVATTRSQLVQGARRSQERSAAEKRAALREAAAGQLSALQHEVIDRLRSSVDGLTLTESEGLKILRAGPAGLALHPPNLKEPGRYPRAGQEVFDPMPFEVLASSTIAVGRLVPGKYAFVGRAHSLYYCNPPHSTGFAWHEIAFKGDHVLEKGDHLHLRERVTEGCDCYECRPTTEGQYRPHALEHTWIRDYLGTVMNGKSSYIKQAWPLTRLVAGDLDEFVDRWARWLAMAAQGSLTRDTDRWPPPPRKKAPPPQSPWKSVRKWMR
ncbi:MAG: serine/threonine protein kinase [Kineosporiaceae bacterium]|nr:serine/threonine protein kinase [Kineosporiaceae bacterium]